MVSGASSGIGRAVAVALAGCGARVVLLGRNRAQLEVTRTLIGSDDTRLVEIDLRDSSAIGPAIREVAHSDGRIYGLCHCAGLVETRPLSGFDPAGFRALMDINVTAGLHLAQAVSRRDVMCDEGGSIVFVSSVYARVGMPGQVAYAATKGALLSAARSMAMELARRRIRVNTLSPGLVKTPMTEKSLARLTAEQLREFESAYPLGPGEPEDVGRAAAFLLAPQSRWITGSDLVVDGGYCSR